VQHIALQSEDIVRTVAAMKERGVLFLDTPDAYYDEVEGAAWARSARTTPTCSGLKILADRD